MLLFTSSFENKLDKKGRVSVPARYRTLLDANNEPLYITCALTGECLDGMGQGRLQQIATTLDSFDAVEDRKLYEFYLSQALEMRPDSEGRIMLTEHFIGYAGLRETVLFVGIGGMFQIWNPAGYDEFTKESRKRIKEGKLPPLRLQAKNGGGG